MNAHIRISVTNIPFYSFLWLKKVVQLHFSLHSGTLSCTFKYMKKICLIEFEHREDFEFEHSTSGL